MSGLGNVSDEILNEILQTIRSQDNQAKIHAFVLEPVLQYIADKSYPYFLSLAILLLINIIFLAVIIYYLVRKPIL